MKGMLLHQHAAYPVLSGLLLAQGRTSEARPVATRGVMSSVSKATWCLAQQPSTFSR